MLVKKTPKSFVIPDTYAELQIKFGDFIRGQIAHYNKVPENLDDLHSYIWVRIMEADLLGKFKNHIASQAPKVVTALEACQVLGVSWVQWYDAMRRYHLEGEEDMWMPTPLNAEALTNFVGERNAIFSFGDILTAAHGERVRGLVRRPFPWMGRSIITETGEDMDEARTHLLMFPTVKATMDQFRNYLRVSILNSCANFFRTVKRKHKERTQKVRQGEEGEFPAWEETLQDTKTANAFLTSELAAAKSLLLEILRDVADTSPDREQAIFGSLENGCSIQKALRDSGLSAKTCETVILTIQSVR